MVGSICSSYLSVQLAVLRDAIADNQPCFSYVDMKALTGNLLQTSIGDNSFTLLVKLSHIYRDRKSERWDTDYVRKVDSHPFRHFPFPKALSAVEAITVGLVCLYFIYTLFGRNFYTRLIIDLSNYIKCCIVRGFTIGLLIQYWMSAHRWFTAQRQGKVIAVLTGPQ